MFAPTTIIEPANLGLPVCEGMHHVAVIVAVHPTFRLVLAELVGIGVVNLLMMMMMGSFGCLG